MKTRFLSWIILLVLIAEYSFAQYYTPQSPLTISKDNLKKDVIVQTIQSQRVLYTPLDIDELRLQISKNNNAVDNEISMIKSKMSNLFMDKQELLQLKDIQKIRDVIEEKKNNRKEIEMQVQNDLSGINYKGLFIVVLKSIDPWASKQQLSEKSEKALTPKAIEDLNGIFVSSMTSVEQSKLIIDKIQTVISGEMSIEKQYISRTIDNRDKFLYLVKINVAPLKKSIQAATGETIALENALIINALTAKDYGTRLQSFGVSQDEIRKVDLEVQSSQESIQLANATASRRQMDILRNGNANLNKIDEEIQNLENSLANRSGILKQIIESKTDVTFDPQNSDQSINAALKFLDSRLEDLKSQLIQAKEQELIPRYSVSVTAEGTPAEDIAKTAMDISGQIEQSYSKIEQFIEETTVQNFMLTEEKKSSQEDVYRKLDTVWLYPVAGDQDNFYLTVVAKFSLRDGEKVSDRELPVRQKPDAEMVFVAGGTFMMGSDNVCEKPIHKVYLGDFYMDKYEVTNAQFCEFLNEKGNQSEGGSLWLNLGDTDCKIVKQGNNFVPLEGYANHPAIQVSWYGANAFAKWAGKRLPSEAEWEYASRGGNQSKGYIYSGSDNIDLVAWYSGNSDWHSHPVGTKQPNELGLYDMSGNAWEWCLDWYDCGYYSRSPYENPQGPSSGQNRVYRGGCYFSVEDNYCRVTFRLILNPVYISGRVGFRCVRSAQQEKPSKQSSSNTMMDIDGNIYKTVKIGDQVWMAENLRVTHYRNGEPIPNLSGDVEWNESSTGAYCYYENNPANASVYGCIYNLFAVNDSRNIAPEGWRIPSRSEWDQLIDFLGGWTTAGGKLKEVGKVHWNSPNTGATNSSGFTSRAGGYRMVHPYKNSFFSLHERAIFLSSSNVSYWMVYNNSEMSSGDVDEQMGFSVRCVKD